MRLGRPRFERELRRRARRAIRNSPRLRREARRQRRTRAGVLWGLLGRIVEPGLLFLLLSVCVGEELLRLRLALLTLRAFANVAAGMRRAGRTLGNNWMRAALYLLPISTRDVCRAQARLYWKEQMWRVAWAPALTWALLEFQAPDLTVFMGAMILVVLQYLLAAVLALQLLTWGASLGLRAGSLSTLSYFFGSGYVAAVVLFHQHGNGAPWTARAVGATMWLPGFGWLSHGFLDWMQAPSGGSLWTVVGLLTAGLVFALWPMTWSRLLETYHLPELEFAATATAAEPEDQRGGLAPETSEPRASPPSGHEMAAPSDAPEVEARRMLHACLHTPALDWWRGGPLERFVDRLLTPQERIAGIWLLGRPPRWGLSYPQVGVAMLALVLALSVLPWNGLTQTLLFLGVLWVLGFAWSGWAGAGAYPVGNVSVPFAAVYPLGFRALAGVIAKSSLVRLGLLLPPVAGAAVVLAWARGWPWFRTFETAVVGWMLVWATQPLMIMMQLSAGTNDTQRVQWWHLALLLPLFLTGAAVVLFTVTVADTFSSRLIGVGLLAAVTRLTLRLYGVAWNRGWFDLARAQRN